MRVSEPWPNISPIRRSRDFAVLQKLFFAPTSSSQAAGVSNSYRLRGTRPTTSYQRETTTPRAIPRPRE